MSQFSRRQLLKAAFVAGGISALPTPLLAASRAPLSFPPLIEIRRGKPIVLSAETTQAKLDGSRYAEVWGFNGNYLGPTIKIRSGEFAKLNYRNGIPQILSLNIQGLQASGELLGGIGRHFKMSETWAPIVPINQPAATCWYHACTLASSAYQTYRGLLGLWIIEDEESRKSSLPKKYGVDDIPLILQDVQLNADGVQLFSQNQPHFLGDRLFVNGQQAPYLTVPRSWVRLRILNASLSRGYHLHFDDDREFLLLAKDQGFLPQGQTRTSIFVAPSERVELLVDLNDGNNVTLISGKKRSLLDKFTQFFESGDALMDNTVLELRPEGMAAAFATKPAFQSNTTAPAVLAAKGQKERQFHIDVSNATINQQRLDPRRIDVNAVANSTERWILTASQATGFKVQGARFVIESINDQPLEPSEQAWKDSLWIEGKVQILINFPNLSSNNHPLFFGSSDLMLADRGCLGVIIVQ